MISSTQPQAPSRIQAMIQNNWSINKPLTILTVGCAIISVLAIFGVLADPRQILGQPVWAKTTKFSISIALYGSSMLWMLGMLKTRASRIAGNIIGATLILEMLLLITQAIRGRAMHFNIATPIDTALWGTMSFGILVFSIAAIVATILLLRVKLESRVLVWSLRLGLILAILGFAQASLMTGPNNLQINALKSGQQLEMIGAHTVGVLKDGGPSIPFLGWSTDHGDLRIGHFIGMHGLQIIPLFGFFLIRRRSRWLTESHRVGLVFIAAIGYAGLVGLVTWQALRDQSIISPDALTLQALAAIIGTVALSSLAVIFHARSKLVTIRRVLGDIHENR